MPSLVRMAIPVEDMPFSATISQLPGCQYRVEQSAFTGQDHSIHLWITCDDPSAIGSALATDSSVKSSERLLQRGSEHLFELELTHQLLVPRDIIRHHGGVVARAYGDEDAWVLEARFPDRDTVSDVDDAFDRYDIEVDYDAIVETGSMTDGSSGLLTDRQREALVAALEEGYFEVPRQVTLAELADDLGVTHQALSERLRRAQLVLLEEHFAAETAPATAESAETASRREGTEPHSSNSYAH